MFRKKVRADIKKCIFLKYFVLKKITGDIFCIILECLIVYLIYIYDNASDFAKHCSNPVKFVFPIILPSRSSRRLTLTNLVFDF